MIRTITPVARRSPSAPVPAAGPGRTSCPTDDAFWSSVQAAFGIEAPLVRLQRRPWATLGLPAQATPAKPSATVLPFRRTTVGPGRPTPAQGAVQ